MTLHLSVLPPPQRALWEQLSGVPCAFVLYGGTAIALQLGHRQSIDFDFFAREAIDPERLMVEIDFLEGCEPLQLGPNTLTVRVNRKGAVLLSFFGVPRLPILREPHPIEHPRLRIAHLLELGGMKAMVVQKRAEAKDYIDIHALMGAGITLPEMLSAAARLYGQRFAPEITLKSLSFFDDGNLAQVPIALRRDLGRAVRACDPLKLPPL